MVSKGKAVVKRLGRPPDTDSADTRDRILSIAQDIFSVHGYEVTTNRTIATAVGITPAALYHYFGSKLDLYLAVHETVQGQVYGEFLKAVDGESSFIAQFEAVLDSAYRLNVSHPSLARFVGSVRVDSRRHPEMAAALAPRAEQRERFFGGMVSLGIKTGEIAPDQRFVLQAFLLTVLIGLTDAVSDDPNLQKVAITGIKQAMRGNLLVA